ncbi:MULTISPECIES: DUF503 domain-containing protein [Syntrophotalea]|jgi:hypothetical protein|uniref:YlxP-like protein n=1 Tax=Syntrophotalea acetylenica TaxID=29542 RepID=A0A1L3GJN0_SYNAC|nr:DUF503 domain-containing protein [Syntrophotalea acetylenica]APG25888.1 hypothetical protein A7E75_13360 [Syntrophotalea acetylenica]APG43960.1 hypothetical protein A6070_07390 [Syntrophotalea acetylenica]MDY0262736.1 DUF503 domain-containing protein [Syntrophotalea acetylenica]
MVVGVLRVELHIHGPQSLKQKRSIVKSLLGRCRSRFPVSCAEVDHHELWQRTTLGCVVVEQDEAAADRILQKVVAELEHCAVADLCRQDIEFIHYR